MDLHLHAFAYDVYVLLTGSKTSYINKSYMHMVFKRLLSDTQVEYWCVSELLCILLMFI